MFTTGWLRWIPRKQGNNFAVGTESKYWKLTKLENLDFYPQYSPAPRGPARRIGVYTENAITSSIFIFTLTNTLSFNQNFIL